MHRWKLSALAAAAFVSTALTATNASALSLGSLNVRSALGENLKAEIAIPQATAAELNSLVAQIASAETFRAQGMDFSNAARSIQVQLHRNADGTASLHLSSSAPIQEPFVDLVLETQWSTGHLVRSYTLLVDPPAAQRSAAAPTTQPQIAAPAASAPASVSGRTYNSSAAPANKVAPAPVSTASNDASTRVRSGDTAGRIANANRPAGVSLDQMLVAMLRSNPEAFINGNVNRIRAGAVVQMPSRDQALETSRTEARQIVAAQSRDFNAYRRSLASKAPQAPVQAADRSSGGQVQAHVEETRASAETPDKLTLSKGSMQNAAAEAKVAEQKQANDQDNRLNELQRNLAELNDLAQNSANPAAAAANAPSVAQADTKATSAAAEVTPAAAPEAPALEVASATAAAAIEAPTPPATDAAAAPEATDASASTSAATADAAPTPEAPAAKAEPQPAKPATATPVPAPVAEASLMDDLRDNPMVPAGAGLIAVLLGLLGYTAWKRRRTAQATQDPSLGDSQLQPDSFFGSSGGQQVDTSNADTGASTMAYSPSQLDGGGDVDPVAEADVYLAYGRDVQAEEILKEALRSQPGRLSVHVKLAEIYVKRHDIKALEGIARTMQDVSSSQDPEWQRVVDMGRHMDPTNAFFAAANTGAGTSAASNKPTSPFAAALSSVKPENTDTVAATAATAAAIQALPDIDLNLDLPDDGISQSAVPAATPPAAPLPSDDDYAALDLSKALDSQLDVSAPPVPEDPPTLVQDTLMAQDDSAHDLSSLDLDLSSFDVAPMATPAPAAAAPEPTPTLDAGLNFDLDSPLPPVSEPTPVTPPPAAPVAAEKPADTSGLDFDLGALDLDLGAPAAPAASAQPVHNLADDPLSTKLDLAQEFNSIGDSEGARALIEEVLADASGPLKERAQKMLSELD